MQACALSSVSTEERAQRNLNHQIVKSNGIAVLIRPRSLFEMLLFYHKANSLNLQALLLQYSTTTVQSDGLNLLWGKRRRGGERICD